MGEHSAEIRAGVCAGLECLGLHLERDANVRCQPDADLSEPNSPGGRILVISTQEDQEMLRQLLNVLD